MNNKWVDGFSRSLIQHAARTAPASLSERLEEEWSADFAERSGRLARLRFAVGCCWATRVIAHEYLEPKVVAATAAGPTTGSRVMSAFAQPDYSFLSRRTTAFVLIIGLHAVIIYGFATGLGHKVKDLISRPIDARVWDAPKRVDLPPELPPPPKLTRTIIEVPSTETKIEVDRSGLQEVVTAQPTEFRGPGTAESPPHVVNRVSGGPGKSFPNTDDYYPAPEIRMEHQGLVTVRVCTDDKGKLTAAPTLAETSGWPGLDQGALKLAQAGSGRYRATTEDGRPVSSCYPFRVRFQYKN
ncbi:MAG: periplasmic protein TonB [Gammaproteobacteria bacterium]|nr:periplasmic protein TonB [Gammaproteobacteria bacterium]